MNIIRSTYESVLCCVRAGYDHTDFFDCPTGVKQGWSAHSKVVLSVITVAEDLEMMELRHGI